MTVRFCHQEYFSVANVEAANQATIKPLSDLFGQFGNDQKLLSLAVDDHPEALFLIEAIVVLLTGLRILLLGLPLRTSLVGNGQVFADQNAGGILGRRIARPGLFLFGLLTGHFILAAKSSSSGLFLVGKLSSRFDLSFLGGFIGGCLGVSSASLRCIVGGVLLGYLSNG